MMMMMMMRATARLISINGSYWLVEHSTLCTCFDSCFRVRIDIYTRIQYQKQKTDVFFLVLMDYSQDEENKMSSGNNNNLSIINETSFWLVMLTVDIDCLDV